MQKVSDIVDTAPSGYNHIDSLLDTGPDWNYLTAADNTIAYTFSTSYVEGEYADQIPFSISQQQYARKAMAYLSGITGIKLAETSISGDAQVHFASVNLPGATTTGLTSWRARYTYVNEELVSYDADAYIYLDNVEWQARNAMLTSGGVGYETLLHELGHAFGLKHPFEGDIRLPREADNSSNTLMSYTSQAGPYATFNSYDIAALNWIYGGDGLRGSFGINSTTGGRFITGTSSSESLIGTASSDKFVGLSGNDIIHGNEGLDNIVLRGASNTYRFSKLGNEAILIADTLQSRDGIDALIAIERAEFSDGNFDLSALVGKAIQSTPPAGTFSLAGGAEDDRFTELQAGTFLDGLSGVDTVHYSGRRADFTVLKAGNGFEVVDLRRPEGADTLINVERITFSDGSLALDIDGSAGQAFRLYQAAFARSPDSAGLGYWIQALDTGASLDSVAKSFINSEEFRNLYGAAPSDENYITALYSNVLHRAPDQPGFDFWLTALKTGVVQRHMLLTEFSESFENQVQVIGSIAYGIEYLPMAV